jgi:hypothetical protein
VPGYCLAELVETGQLSYHCHSQESVLSGRWMKSDLLLVIEMLNRGWRGPKGGRRIPAHSSGHMTHGLAYSMQLVTFCNHSGLE